MKLYFYFEEIIEQRFTGLCGRPVGGDYPSIHIRLVGYVFLWLKTCFQKFVFFLTIIQQLFFL